jgi:hypothetical protein
VFEQRKTYLEVILDRMLAFKEIYRCFIESFTGSAENTTEPLDLYPKYLAYSMKDAMIAKVFIANKSNVDISCSAWFDSWEKVQDYLKDSQNLLGKNHSTKSDDAEYYMNDAICEIMRDRNFMVDKQSLPDVMVKINLLLQNAVKAHGHDDENIQFYPITEWRQLNPN